jgi:serine/threonine protein kinase
MTLGRLARYYYTIAREDAKSPKILAIDRDPFGVVAQRVSLVKTTLVETPPEESEQGEGPGDFIRASSLEDLAAKTHIGSEAVLNRVLLPGKQFGPYLIRGFIAAGGMGEIYAAQRIAADGRKSRPLALKVIAAEYANDWRIIERFKREARISKALRSPHVARVYEFGESPEGHVFLSMELLRGEELYEKLNRVKMLTAQETAHLALQILEGLHTIHASGFVHRDIKPENIYLVRNAEGRETVKILDFGIAKRQDQRSDPLLSVAGQIYGTPQYLAPEQALSPDVDTRADLYSLGVLMYEAVAGNLPFDGETPYALILAHQEKSPPPLPSTIDPEFEQIVMRALAKKPEARYQSAREMAAMLSRWLDGDGESVPATGSEVLLRPTQLTPFMQRTSVPLMLNDTVFDDHSEESVPGLQGLARRPPGGEAEAVEPAAQTNTSADDAELASARRAALITKIAVGLIAIAVLWAMLQSLL